MIELGAFRALAYLTPELSSLGHTAKRRWGKKAIFSVYKAF